MRLGRLQAGRCIRPVPALAPETGHQAALADDDGITRLLVPAYAVVPTFRL